MVGNRVNGELSVPRSTPLMRVAAFAGYDLAIESYREAVEERYRFFSYGDATLIL